MGASTACEADFATRGQLLDAVRPVPGRSTSIAPSRDEIALLLAEVALAAGPAVMEVYEHGCEARAKGDGSPVTARRPARRGDHLRPSSAAPSPPTADRRRGSGGGRRADRRRRALPADRPARRHARIHRPQRRIHHQCRADRERAGRSPAPSMRRRLAACGSAATAPSSATRRSAPPCPPTSARRAFASARRRRR